MTTKANLIDGSSHKKRYEHKFNNNNKNIKSNGNNTNMFKPKPNNFKKKGNCFEFGKPDHHASQIKRETTILLKLRSTWLKEKTSLLRLFFKLLW
jgi:hypothetical protein